MDDTEILEKAAALKAASNAAHERFKRTLTVCISLPADGSPAAITALRGSLPVGQWTVQPDGVLETVAAILDGEAAQ